MSRRVEWEWSGVVCISGMIEIRDVRTPSQEREDVRKGKGCREHQKQGVKNPWL